MIDLLVTPWSKAGVPVPADPSPDGPPPLARVDVTPRADVPAPRSADVPTPVR